MANKEAGFSTGTRILLVLAALVLVSVGGGSTTIYYIYRSQQQFDSVVGRDVAELGAANELKTALLNQKGFVTYYFLDGDPQWLEQLEVHRKAFESWLQKSREYSGGEREDELIKKIESEYIRYVITKERVIEHYRVGDHEAGKEEHWEVRQQFFDLYALCDQYNNIIEQDIARARDRAGKKADFFSLIALTAMAVSLGLGLILAFVLATQLLGPIRRLAVEAGAEGTGSFAGDEVSALENRVHGLIENVGQAQSELAKSRERLLHSEKMAVVGKLAADVAHSIRNPMTSIKMRLFSLERSLELNVTQKEDFEVVSEEMRRLDNIVRNFLEFSRAPKLKMQRVNISDILDMTLDLLHHRFERHNVELVRSRAESLPEVNADPELVKEVFLNLVVNALEAMSDDCKLTIGEEEAVAEQIGSAVVVRITDVGPGIAESIQEKIFEPFFSTKEEGTGLGLPMAMRIIEEHGGSLELRSEEGRGATFIITLPVREETS